MVFLPPTWLPALARDIPDSIPLCDFMLDEEYGRCPLAASRAPFTCGLTGKEFSAYEVKSRVEHLSSSLAQELNWNPEDGSEWGKVGAVFALNTVRSRSWKTPSSPVASH